MTHEQFCFWLSGYLAALETVDLSREDVKRIKDELAALTPRPSLGNPYVWPSQPSIFTDGAPPTWGGSHPPHCGSVSK